MKIISYIKDGQEKVGLYENGKIQEVKETLEEIISGNEESITLTEEIINAESVQYLPAVPNTSKIICVGLNYQKHAEEAKLPVPESPILFNKFSNSLVGNNVSVILTDKAVEYDYEAELGVVIGKTTKNVNRENALEHVFGYCNVNDLSARDLQRKTSQWMLGKIMDGFCPVGPYLVTADEVGDPNNLAVKSYVNGELRQNSNTKDMIFYVDEIISYISQYMTLEPGDLILTGTPEGVVAGFPEDEREWLKSSDTVTIEIEKLGTLTNNMEEE